MIVPNYDPIIALLNSALLTNIELSGVINGNVYPAYINELGQEPEFPCLTIIMDTSQTLKNQTGASENHYYIHGWTKNGPDEAAYLYNLVISTIDLNPPPGLLTCRKTEGKAPLYNNETRTHYFMSKWLIYKD